MVSVLLKTILSTWVGLTGFSVLAADLPWPISNLQKKMQGKTQIFGNFQQERMIPSMKTKLNSEGTFEIRKPQRVRWHQTSPFVSTFVISKNKATLKLGEGNVKNLDLRAQPAMLAVGQILSALFLGDSESIKPYFEVQVLLKETANSKRWSLKLLPKKELMKKVLEPIVVSGDQFIEALEIKNKSGNLTKIHFTDVKTQ